MRLTRRLRDRLEWRVGESIALRTDGYRVINLATVCQVELLNELATCTIFNDGGDDKFRVSIRSNGFTRNLEISNRILEILSESLESVLAGYEALGGAVVSKLPDQNCEIVFHQDYSFVDERQDRSLSLWLPLSDVDESNGALHMAPGSHRLFTNPRGPQLPSVEIHFDDMPANTTQRLDMRAGQALIYDPRVFHGSLPNMTDIPRNAVTLGLVPTGVGLAIARLHGTRVSLHEAEKHTPLRVFETPDGVPVETLGRDLGEIAYQPVSTEEAVRRIGIATPHSD